MQLSRPLDFVQNDLDRTLSVSTLLRLFARNLRTGEATPAIVHATLTPPIGRVSQVSTWWRDVRIGVKGRHAGHPLNMSVVPRDCCRDCCAAQSFCPVPMHEVASRQPAAREARAGMLVTS